eukprot:13392639-Alexandrium_andersonii.AAC.1
MCCLRRARAQHRLTHDPLAATERKRTARRPGMPFVMRVMVVVMMAVLMVTMVVMKMVVTIVMVVVIV